MTKRIWRLRRFFMFLLLVFVFIVFCRACSDALLGAIDHELERVTPTDLPRKPVTVQDVEAAYEGVMPNCSDHIVDANKMDSCAGGLVSATQPNETELLARTIYAEARGESFRGKVAVGAVVMNRVAAPEWPDTVAEVVNAQGQFAVAACTDSECVQAAEAAMAGDDPTGGAVYFYNPVTARCGWIREREAVANVGNHTFAR